MPEGCPDTNDVWCTLPYTKTLVGCSHTSENLVVYSREAAVDAIEFLIDQKKTRVVLDGPPGSGKSSVAWYYALLYSKEDVVCWVDVKNRKILTLDQEIITLSAIKYGEFPDLPGNLLVLDGITHNDLNMFRDCIADISRSKIVIVSSLQFDLKVKNFDKYTMNAWTLVEYNNAVAYDMFFNQVLQNLLLDDEVEKETYNTSERRQLILRKFRFAGHSARYMFDLNVEAVVEDISYQIEQVSNYQEIFEIKTGHRAPGFKNTLIVTDPKDQNHTIFTSAYVSRRLGMKCPDSITTLRNLVEVHGSNAMRGQAFEAEFLYMARHSNLNDRVFYVKEDKLYPEDGGFKEGVEDTVDAGTTAEGLTQSVRISAQQLEDETAAVPRTYEDRADNSFQANDGEIEFYNKILNQDTDIRIVTEERWLVPVVPNQGGFDCVKLCARPDGTTYLRFVQLTVQLDHPIKMNHMRIFIEDFNQRRESVMLSRINHFEVVVVLPAKDALSAQSPGEWKVTGLPRALRSGNTNTYTFHYRVAGYFCLKK